MKANGIEKNLVYAVDDDQEILELVKGTCEMYGKRVEAFNSGDAALEAIMGGGRPEVLITDQQMPGVTGVELSEEVMKRSPGTFRYLHTGYSGSEESLRKAIANHVIDQFGFKPYSIREICTLAQRDNYTH